MCRMSIKINQNTIDSCERKWSFIDREEINYTEYLYEMDQIFVAGFYKLINRI